MKATLSLPNTSLPCLQYDANAEPGFVSLEGYLVGRLAIAALDACGAEVTRACFLREARGLDSIEGLN